jgi:hypothetical protein
VLRGVSSLWTARGAPALESRRHIETSRATDRSSPAFEDVFRQINDRIVELGERFGFRDDRPLELICECRDAACTERIAISRSAYERVRVMPHRHLVVAGHERSARVVARNRDYVVVDD